MSGHTQGPWDWGGQILVRMIQAGEVAAAEHPHLAGEWDEVILGVLDDLELASEFVDSGGREYCDWLSEANARLIAAAPDGLIAGTDLLDVVKAAIRAGDWKVDGACDPDAAIRRMEQFIAKATGEQP